MRPLQLPSLFLAALSAFSGCEPARIEKPGSQLAVGWDNFSFGAYDNAARAFQEVAHKNPESSPAHLEALHGLANTWSLRRPGENPRRAAELFERIVRLGPQSDLAAWSLLALARLEHLQGAEPADLTKLQRAYQRVIDQFPNHPAAEEAFLFQQARCVVATLAPDDARAAITNLTKFAETHPQSKYLGSIYQLIASSWETLGQPDQRLSFAIKAMENLEIDPTNPRSDKAGAYWAIAVLAEYEVGDFATARDFYRRLMNEYKTDERVYAAGLELQRMDEMERQARDGTLALDAAPAFSRASAQTNLRIASHPERSEAQRNAVEGPRENAGDAAAGESLVLPRAPSTSLRSARDDLAGEAETAPGNRWR